MYNIRHKKEERADLDYYSTDPDSVRALLAVEKFNTNILEPVGGSAVAYAWFVWLKGSKNEPILRWLN